LVRAGIRNQRFIHFSQTAILLSEVYSVNGFVDVLVQVPHVEVLLVIDGKELA
jgi:hypothetical protein